jgi:hypothetical protein
MGVRDLGSDIHIADGPWLLILALIGGRNRLARAIAIATVEPPGRLGVFGNGPGAYRMLDGFSKREFAIFAAVLLVAGALTVGAVDFVIYHHVFQDTGRAPILAK